MLGPTFHDQDVVSVGVEKVPASGPVDGQVTPYVRSITLSRATKGIVGVAPYVPHLTIILLGVG